MIGKRRIAGIAALRAWGVLLLVLVLAAMPGLGLAQEENAPDNSFWAWVAGLIPWETMFGWVQVKGVAEGLAFAILIVFLAVLVWLCVVWWNSASALWRFRQKIQATPREPYGFAEYYRELGLDISGKKFAGIKHAWNEFRESIFPEKNDEDRILAYNTTPPENFFTPEKLGMNFTSFRELANYFVGVGLLLTFFGLAAALFFANISIAEGAGDVNKTQDALQSLLHAATLKFMTSIAGLFSSVALSVFVLMASRNVSQLCADICEELEARVRFVAQEEFAIKQWRELREHTKVLKTFSTDLAVSIAQRIAQPVSAGVLGALNESGLSGLAGTMGEVNNNVKELMSKVDGVRGKLDALAGDIAGEIVEPVKLGVEDAMKPLEADIKRLANSVVEGGKEGVDKITKGIPGEIKAAADTIKEASGNLQEASGKLERGASNLETQIANAGQAFGRKMGTASGSVAATVSGIQDQVIALRDAMKELVGILESQRTEFHKLVGATQTAAGALNSAADQHRQAAQPVADAAQRISDAANTISELGRTVADTHQSLAKLHEQIGKSNVELRQFWEAHDGRFAGVDRELAGIVERILKSNDDYQKSVTNFVTELAKKLEDALGQISGAIQELGEVAEDLRGGRKG